MTTIKSARQKGKELENYVADQIVVKGLDPKARRNGDSGSGNREKADIITSLTILGRNAGIEAKNQATLHIPAWWEQTLKLQKLGLEPILAFKQFGEGYGETKVIIYLDTFLDLIKQANACDGIIPTEEDPVKNRELKWAISNLKVAISKINKLID